MTTTSKWPRSRLILRGPSISKGSSRCPSTTYQANLCDHWSTIRGKVCSWSWRSSRMGIPCFKAIKMISVWKGRVSAKIPLDRITRMTCRRPTPAFPTIQYKRIKYLQLRGTFLVTHSRKSKLAFRKNSHHLAQMKKSLVRSCHYPCRCSPPNTNANRHRARRKAKVVKWGIHWVRIWQ